MAAEAFQPAMPLADPGAAAGALDRRPGRAVLAVLGFAVYKVVSGVGRRGPRPRPASIRPPRASRRQARRTADAVQGRRRPSARRASPAPAGSSSASSPTPTRPRPVAWPRPGVAGVRPGRPGRRRRCRASRRRPPPANPAAPWYSHWYATPDFGGAEDRDGPAGRHGPRRSRSPRCGCPWAPAPAPTSQLRAGARPVPAGCARWRRRRTRGGTVHWARRAGARPLPAHLVHQAAARQRRPYQASVYRITVQGQPTDRRLVAADRRRDLPSRHD